MVHKVKNVFPYIRKFFAAIIVIAVISFLLGQLPYIESMQVFASSGSDENTRDDILMTIINKTLPIVGTTMKYEDDKEPSQPVAYALFKYITRADYENPRSYLTSQLPLLGMYEINTFSAKAGSLSSRGTGTISSATPGAVPIVTPPLPSGTPDENSQNFGEDVPVNTTIDYNKPAVLIYHTHTSEAYEPTDNYYYDDDADSRGAFKTTDPKFTVCLIGEEIKEYIETYYGIAVIHDTTVHDEKYTGSYDKSRPTAENLIKKYPDASFVIDLHRDAAVPRKDMIASIGGQEAARISFVIGQKNPRWQENYQLAEKIGGKVEELFPGLYRKITTRPNILYNQDLSNRSIIIEIGSEVTTMEESLISARMVAKAIGELLKGN